MKPIVFSRFERGVTKQVTVTMVVARKNSEVRMTLSFLRPAWLAALAPLLLAACSSGSGTSTSSNPVTQATAQSTATHTTAVSCFDDFKKCVDAATSTTALGACKDALAACLPTQIGPPPPPPDVCDPDPGHGGSGSGGGCHGAPDGMVPPPFDGGTPPPPPNGGGPGGPDKGPGGPGGPGGGGSGGPGFPITPTGRADIAVCMASLKLCMTSGTDPQVCVTQAHQCVHDALLADFAQICMVLEKACSVCPKPTPICVDITARCAAGLPLPDQP
jgi:hypothetical protein